MMCEVSSFQEYRHREEMEGVRMVVGKEGHKLCGTSKLLIINAHTTNRIPSFPLLQLSIETRSLVRLVENNNPLQRKGQAPSFTKRCSIVLLRLHKKN